MAIADNFRAIKAALNRLTGAAPSGEAFSGLKDAKRVTGEHDFSAASYAKPMRCTRCLSTMESALDFPAMFGKCPGAPLAAGTILFKQRFFRYEADGKGGVAHVQTRPEPPLPGATARVTVLSQPTIGDAFTIKNDSDQTLTVYQNGNWYLAAKPGEPANFGPDVLEDARKWLATHPQKIKWAQPSDPNDFSTGPLRLRGFVEVPKDYGMYGSASPRLTPDAIIENAFRMLSDSQMYASHPLMAGSMRNLPGPETDLNEKALENALMETKRIALHPPLPHAYPPRGPNDINPIGLKVSDFVRDSFAWSVNFREGDCPNCCGNPVCAICADGRHRGVTVEQHGNPALHAQQYQGREIVFGWDMTGSAPVPMLTGLSFRLAGSGNIWCLVDLHRPLPLDYEACDLGNEGLVVFERKFWPEGGATFYRGDALFSIKRDEDVGITIQALR